MGKIAAQFTYHIDIIKVPDFIEKDAKKYQNDFDNWLYDKKNDHGLWVFIKGKKCAVSFGTQDFVDYLNKFVCNGEPVCRIIESNLTEPPAGMPLLFF